MFLANRLRGVGRKFDPVSLAVSIRNGTEISVTLPPAKVGSLRLILIYKAISSGAINTPSGWAQLHQSSVVGQGSLLFAVFYKSAQVGDSSVTVSHTDDDRVLRAHSYAVRDWDQTTPPEINTSSATNSSNGDPPNLSPSWGSASVMWFASATKTTLGGTTLLSTPSGYPAATVTGTQLASTFRGTTASSENPEAFVWSTSSAQISATIGVRLS